MTVTKRIGALLGAVTLTTMLAACGGGSQEVDADEVDPTQGSDAGGSSEESEEEPQPSDPYDGNIVTFGALTEDNIDGLCNEVLGEVEDVLPKINVNVNEIDMSSYSDWTARYEEQVGSIPATFFCYAKASANVEDAEYINIFLATGNATPGEAPDVVTRSEDMTASMSMQTTDQQPDDEVLERFLDTDVLPKFRP